MWCLFHKWVTVGAHHVSGTKDTIERINYVDYILTKDIHQTRVLQQCSKCKQYKTITLEGAWKAEELVGKFLK